MCFSKLNIHNYLLLGLVYQYTCNQENCLPQTIKNLEKIFKSIVSTSYVVINVEEILITKDTYTIFIKYVKIFISLEQRKKI